MNDRHISRELRAVSTSAGERSTAPCRAKQQPVKNKSANEEIIITNDASSVGKNRGQNTLGVNFTLFLSGRFVARKHGTERKAARLLKKLSVSVPAPSKRLATGYVTAKNTQLWTLSKQERWPLDRQSLCESYSKKGYALLPCITPTFVIRTISRSEK